MTAAVLADDAGQLRARLLRLKRRLQLLLAIVRLLLVRMARLRLDSKRRPDAERKQQLLDGIARATRIVPRSVALRVVGLKPARYHAWRQKAPCNLDDRTSCPKARPTQLAPTEVRAMRDMVTSLEFRHFSVRALALHAQRIGRVFEQRPALGRGTSARTVGSVRVVACTHRSRRRGFARRAHTSCGT